MKYEEVPNFGIDTIERLESENFEVVQMALLSVVLYSDNYGLALKTIRRFLLHDNEYIRGSAIECISHVARLWKKLPDDLIASANDSLYDKSEWVQGKGDFVIDDLEVFIKDYRRL